MSMELELAEAEAVSADGAGSVIAAEGMFNLRDLGGFAVAGGRRVKRGRIYRSDDLSGLTESGQAVLSARKIRTVVDFRGCEEVALAPNRIPPAVARQVRLPIEPGNVIVLGRLTPETAPEMMCELYRVLARESQEAYRELFALLADSGNAPLLFHCSAGKDRTGFAAALFLLSLGVPRQAVFDDYLRSAELVREKYRRAIEDDARYAAVYTVRSSYLEAAFEVIDREYGGCDVFLTRRLGVDLSLMRSLYTE